MRPILVTLPRTGSTLITELLGSIAIEHYGYKNTLQEYFSLNTLYKERFDNVNGIVKSTYFERVNGNHYPYKVLELQKRIDLLSNDYNYMIKVLVDGPLETVVTNFIKNYDIIYLERKDRLTQYISHMHMSGVNISHYKKNSPNVKQIVYWSNLRDEFLELNRIYYDFKKSNSSNYPTIYYEDFMEHGGDKQALVKLLNLDISVNNEHSVSTIPTPYTSTNIEDLILNKKEWLQDREYIYNALYKDM